MKRNTVIAAVVAFGMGGLVGAFTLLAPSLPERSRHRERQTSRFGVRCNGPSRWTNGAKAKHSGARLRIVGRR